jgi:hypothetical protein
VSRLVYACALILTFAVTSAHAQTKTETTPEKITIVLADGPLFVDEVTEEADGYWYKRGNMSKFLDRARVLRIEPPKPPAEEKTADDDVVEGTGKWKLSNASKVEEFFLAKFKKPLPLSAFGQSDLHTRWGWDHRNGMDVGLHPDSTEGRALIEFLRAESIPFLAFRGAVPGVATGPHIHIGNRSPRITGRR